MYIVLRALNVEHDYATYIGTTRGRHKLIGSGPDRSCRNPNGAAEITLSCLKIFMLFLTSRTLMSLGPLFPDQESRNDSRINDRNS